jgi:hypothetical protein
MHRKRINISIVLAGQHLGIKEVDDGIWIAIFMRYDLGFIDLAQKTLQLLANPFGRELSPMSQVRSVTYIARRDRDNLERAKGFEPSTPTLARLCSTPELHPHPRRATQASVAYCAANIA